MFGKMTGRINFAVVAVMLALTHVLSAQTPELDLAQKQIDANDLAAATSTLDAYLKEHPASAAAWIKRGNLADLAHDDRTALADYDLAEKNGVPPALLTYRRARSYMSLQDTEAALTQLELAMTNGVSLGPKLDDKVFDPIRSTPRFEAILAQNELILHPCADAPHRAFDFWVGDWTVTTQNGPKVGDSSIKRILNDCVILESWTGAGGGTGQSFNNYDSRSKTWKQFWVDASGSRQEYEEGVYRDGSLRFTGHNPSPKGEPVQQRFTFFNLDPNHVRQLQEQSTDGGKTWTVVYDFYYARKTT
jgi:tetratricopeptide (TPR) repeat protein